MNEASYSKAVTRKWKIFNDNSKINYGVGNQGVANYGLANYLLPISSKIYEKCIYDILYNYFEDNDLFFERQSGFRKGDCRVSQLLFITHEIFKVFILVLP